VEGLYDLWTCVYEQYYSIILMLGIGECGILPLEGVDNTHFPICKLGGDKSIEGQ